MKWAYLWIDLIIPALCVIFGAFANKVAAGKINAWIGYRSARSTASREAWEFANLFAGRLLLRGGIAVLIVSLAIALLGFFFLPISVQGSFCTFLTLLQTGALVAVIPVVEKKLKEKFE